MKTLYVIGNGFDLAHGLKTSYWNFREFLEENHPEFLCKFEELYDISRPDFSDPRISNAARKRWEGYVNLRLWSDFENKIGLPDISEMEGFSESVLADMDLDGGLIGIKDTMDVYWKKEYGYIKNFDMYVKEWIESVNTNQIRPMRNALIGSTDLFLSFNYTNTLENVYQIEDVLHIHGGVRSVTDVAPIMGHCNKKDIEAYTQASKQADEEFSEGEASIKRAIANYLNGIYKDTAFIINAEERFWNQLQDINKVVILGLSIGEADLPYLRKIRDSVQPSAKWDIYYHSDHARAHLIRVMQAEEIDRENRVAYIPSSEFWD